MNPLIAKAIAMGDEFHQRNIAATLNFLKEVVPYIIALDWDREEIQQVVEFLANTDQFFLNVMKELSLQFSRMFTNKPDDNKQYYEAQRLSDEILREKSLPRKNYSQRVIKLMQEKIEFFKTNSGKTSIEYNVISGQLSIMNEKQQIICQKK